MIRTIGLRGLLGVAVFAATCLIGVGCSEDDETTQPPDEFAPPSNLDFINGDNSVLLTWTATPDASLDDFAGYNVYRDTASMASLTDAQLATKKITPTPLTSTSHNDAAATNGTRYFYAVRAVKDGGDLSGPTNEINTAARAETETDITLAEFAVPNLPSGLGLSELQSFQLQSGGGGDPDNRLFIDLYLGTDQANDAGGGDLVIKSPHLADGNGTTWTREAGFKLLDDFADATTSDSGWQDTIELGNTAVEIVGRVIAVRTPIEGGEYHYGKIQVTQFNGLAPGSRTINVKAAYQSRANYIRFETPR